MSFENNFHLENPLGLTPSEIDANGLSHVLKCYQRRHKKYTRTRALRRVVKYWCSLPPEKRAAYKEMSYRILLEATRKRKLQAQQRKAKSNIKSSVKRKGKSKSTRRSKSISQTKRKKK